MKGADTLIPVPLEALAVLAFFGYCEHGWHGKLIAFIMEFGGLGLFYSVFCFDLLRSSFRSLEFEGVFAGFPLVDSVLLFLFYPSNPKHALSHNNSLENR